MPLIINGRVNITDVTGLKKVQEALNRVAKTTDAVTSRNFKTAVSSKSLNDLIRSLGILEKTGPIVGNVFRNLAKSYGLTQKQTRDLANTISILDDSIRKSNVSKTRAEFDEYTKSIDKATKALERLIGKQASKKLVQRRRQVISSETLSDARREESERKRLQEKEQKDRDRFYERAGNKQQKDFAATLASQRKEQERGLDRLSRKYDAVSTKIERYNKLLGQAREVGLKSADITRLEKRVERLNKLRSGIQARGNRVQNELGISGPPVVGGGRGGRSGSRRIGGGFDEEGFKRAISNQKKLNTEIAKGSGFWDQFGKASALAFKRYSAFLIGTAIIYRFNAALSEGARNSIELEAQLTKVQQVSTLSSREIAKLGASVTALSSKFGTSSVDIAEGIQTFAQAGLVKTFEDTITLANTLAKVPLAPTLGTIAETTEGLIAIFGQFNKSVEDTQNVLDIVNQYAADFAVESQDIFEAVKRGGATFAAANGTFEEFVELLTILRSSTRESASTLGTFFKSGFAQLLSPGSQRQLRALGVQSTNLVDQLKELSVILDSGSFTRLQKIQIAEALTGERQFARLLALLREISDPDIQAQLEETRKKVDGSFDASIAARVDDLGTSLSRISQSFNEFFNTLIQSDSVKRFAQNIADLASSLAKTAKILEPLIPLFALLGTVLGVRAGAKFAKGGLKQLGITNLSSLVGVGQTRAKPLTGLQLGALVSSEIANTPETDSQLAIATLSARRQQRIARINGQSRLQRAGRLFAKSRLGPAIGIGVAQAATSFIPQPNEENVGGNAALGGLRGGLTGAGLGALTGNPIAIAAGAVIGTIYGTISEGLKSFDKKIKGDIEKRLAAGKTDTDSQIKKSIELLNEINSDVTKATTSSGSFSNALKGIKDGKVTKRLAKTIANFVREIRDGFPNVLAEIQKFALNLPLTLSKLFSRAKAEVSKIALQLLAKVGKFISDISQKSVLEILSYIGTSVSEFINSIDLEDVLSLVLAPRTFIADAIAGFLEGRENEAKQKAALKTLGEEYSTIRQQIADQFITQALQDGKSFEDIYGDIDNAAPAEFERRFNEQAKLLGTAPLKTFEETLDLLNKAIEESKSDTDKEFLQKQKALFKKAKDNNLDVTLQITAGVDEFYKTIYDTISSINKQTKQLSDNLNNIVTDFTSASQIFAPEDNLELLSKFGGEAVSNFVNSTIDDLTKGLEDAQGDVPFSKFASIIAEKLSAEGADGAFFTLTDIIDSTFADLPEEMRRQLGQITSTLAGFTEDTEDDGKDILLALSKFKGTIREFVESIINEGPADELAEAVRERIALVNKQIEQNNQLQASIRGLTESLFNLYETIDSLVDQSESRRDEQREFLNRSNPITSLLNSASRSFSNSQRTQFTNQAGFINRLLDSARNASSARQEAQRISNDILANPEDVIQANLDSNSALNDYLNLQSEANQRLSEFERRIEDAAKASDLFRNAVLEFENGLQSAGQGIASFTTQDLAESIKALQQFQNGGLSSISDRTQFDALTRLLSTAGNLNLGNGLTGNQVLGNINQDLGTEFISVVRSAITGNSVETERNNVSSELASLKKQQEDAAKFEADLRQQQIALLTAQADLIPIEKDFYQKQLDQLTAIDVGIQDVIKTIQGIDVPDRQLRFGGGSPNQLPSSTPPQLPDIPRPNSFIPPPNRIPNPYSPTTPSYLRPNLPSPTRDDRVTTPTFNPRNPRLPYGVPPPLPDPATPSGTDQFRKLNESLDKLNNTINQFGNPNIADPRNIGPGPSQIVALDVKPLQVNVGLTAPDLMTFATPQVYKAIMEKIAPVIAQALGVTSEEAKSIFLGNLPKEL